jgi:hypothetical protein
MTHPTPNSPVPAPRSPEATHSSTAKTPHLRIISVEPRCQLRRVALVRPPCEGHDATVYTLVNVAWALMLIAAADDTDALTWLRPHDPHRPVILLGWRAELRAKVSERSASCAASLNLCFNPEPQPATDRPDPLTRTHLG